MKLLQELTDDSLFEKALSSKAEVGEWVNSKHKSLFGFNRIHIDDVAPWKIDCDEFSPQTSKIFKSPLPVQFEYVKLYLANKCEYLTDLSQLRADSVDQLYIANCKIESLVNCPPIKQLHASETKIASLDGISEDVEIIHISFCYKFTHFGNVVLPNVTRLIMPRTGIVSLEGIEHIFPNLKLLQINASSHLKSHVLGLCKLKHLDNLIGATQQDNPKYDSEKALLIIENVMNESGDIFDAQEQLIEAGLEEFAQL